MHNQTSNLEIDFKTLQIARKLIPAFRFVPLLVGSVSNDDGDSNENGEKTNRKNNNFTRATHFVHFFTVAARLRRENA